MSSKKPRLTINSKVRGGNDLDRCVLLVYLEGLGENTEISFKVISAGEVRRLLQCVSPGSVQDGCKAQ